MRFGVIIFPGSNCDYDAYQMVKSVIKEEVEFLWHQDKDLKNFDCVILPGGFSYGDYLRTGAIARFAPIMKEVYNFAEKGGLVIGICNGFQILLEANLLPGAMLRNSS
ncbi:MAG: phosphoribosylformylglycinamidine synthase subunit PurQ, partial [Candidatus Zixiibacteriota bacterium]